MKKIIYLILGVLLFLPALVKADSSAPGIIPYKATPKSSSGADIYIWDSDKSEYVKTDRKLAYGKVITITWEDDFVEVDQEDEENEDSVKLSDLVPVEKEYKANEKDLAAPEEALILKKMEIKKGPAGGYESTGKSIPANTKVKVRFFQYYDKETKKYLLEDTEWAYVEYNGTKGYIDTTYDVGLYGTYTTIICYDEAEIHNLDNTKILATIKPNIKFNALIYTSGNGYYIEYGNIKGVIRGDALPKGNSVTFKPIEDIKVYEKLDTDDDGNIISKLVTTIPKGTSFSSNYYIADMNYSAVIYYEKNNIKGWIYSNGHEADSGDEDSDYLTPSDILGYDWDEIGVDFVAVEKKENDDKSSAITILKTPKDIDNSEEDDDEDEEDEEKENPTETKPGGSSVAPDQPKTETKAKKRIPELVYYCLGAAVVVSLTAAVTILLVNKKKKNANTEEIKEEAPTEEKNKIKKI